MSKILITITSNIKSAYKKIIIMKRVVREEELMIATYVSTISLQGSKFHENTQK